MPLLSIHSVLLLVSLIVLLLQLFVRQKSIVHIVFAIFCGSMAMFALKQLGDEQLGGYRFVVGMGACATCNGFWLVARALFRETSPVSAKHILAAGGLGLMLIVGQGMGLLQSMAQVELVMLQQSQVALYEVVNLISSCMLVLAAWEGCRGLRKAQGQQLWQRLLFLSSYCSAVLLCTILVKFSDSSDAATELSKVLSTVCAIQIIIVTQVLIYWRFHQKPRYAKHIATGSLNIPLATKEVIFNEQTKITGNEEDRFLAKQIQQVLEQQNMYLQTSLKVADLARHMSVSEYRISRIFRHNFQARNFNQFINEMRIKHAKSLLEDPENAQWSILVVGLESGFASVGPFTRAFKSICDMTPNQYRLFHQSTTEDCSSQVNRTLV